jgi:hypothetical protein
VAVLLSLDWTFTPSRIYLCYLCQHTIKVFGMGNKVAMQKSNTALVNTI